MYEEALDLMGIIDLLFELIEKFFKENLNEINAICFETKSTNNRLTVS